MKINYSIFGALIIIIITLVLICKAIHLLYLKPKRIEKCLRKQGLEGNSYKPFLGDIREFVKLFKEPLLKPIHFCDDPLPRILAFVHHTVQKHGKNCFAWIGPIPWLIISDIDKIKEVLTNYEDFCKDRKPNDALNNLLMVGLFSKEGHVWAKHRKIINPAFHMEKLKNICHTMYESCSIMINSWENIPPFKEGSIEIDVHPFLENLSGDFISRAAFGSSYAQGKRIFDLQREYLKLALFSMQTTNYIPGWRFLPTKSNKRAKEITKEVEEILTRMIESRKAEIKEGENIKADLLGILLESNMLQNDDKKCLTTKEVVEECKLFYFAGSETTSSLLAWTLILLSKHPTWQEQARKEVFNEFGMDAPPSFDGLNRLKIVTMILNEVLRLYSPAYMLMRKVFKDVQLKELLIPAGTEIIIPISIIHRDSSHWGEDSKEFNPERFAEGISEATKGQAVYFPFSAGPRVCIGKNFALLEAKIVLSMILQRYSFDISPSYVHAPYAIITTQPQHGANLILTELNG